MKRPVSSSLTVIYKFIFPSLWIGMFGLGAVLSFSDGDDSAWHFLVALCVGACAFCFLLFPLKIVHIVPGSIVVSNFFKTIQVPFSQISNVTEWRWINIRPVWIHFKEPTEFGTKIMFMPTLHLWPFRAHPIVGELKRLSQEYALLVSQIPYAIKVSREPPPIPEEQDMEAISRDRDKRKWQIVLVSVGVILLLSMGAFCVHLTFIRGNAFGPSFIEDLRNQQVAAESVASLEIIEPAIGHTPFTESEYERLARRRTIQDVKAVEGFLRTLELHSAPGYVHQNHPSPVYESYMKINLLNGDFYYLYVDGLQDHTSLVIQVEANSRNSTNPNGATVYHNDSLKAFILRHDGDNFEG